MSIELVYRMRTCAAALASGRYTVAPTEAADLLLEASNLLDMPDELGEPMELLRQQSVAEPNAAMWTDAGDLPAVKARPCPSCRSVDARTVRRVGHQLMLTCPMCSASWEYGK